MNLTSRIAWIKNINQW